MFRASPEMFLLSDAELCDAGSVALDILLGKVVEKTAALTDHLVHAKTAVVILLVDLEVLGQLSDALREDGDLDLRGTGVVLVGLVVLDNNGLLVFGNHFLRSFQDFQIPLG